MIQTEHALRQKAPGLQKNDIALVPGLHCSSALQVFKTGSEQLVPAGPAERRTSLFEGSDSVDI